MNTWIVLVAALLAGCASTPTTPLLDAVCAMRLIQHGENQTILRVRCERVQEK